ncbi:MAG: RES family NAD+ phosphorylase [Acetobacteraceae bacterium]|nr:RES family NAD+ phosphorylase [Acetobacteraceae bacterium]
MQLFRLGTGAHPVWDGTGAALAGGRWNPPGVPVIYAAGTLSLAMLERLVQRRNLGDTLLVEATAPDDLAWEDLLAAPPRGWQALGSPEAATAGAAWVRAGRTALLRVPSVPVPREPNWLVNPRHPEAVRILAAAPVRLDWDRRRFGIPAA